MRHQFLCYSDVTNYRIELVLNYGTVIVKENCRVKSFSGVAVVLEFDIRDLDCGARVIRLPNLLGQGLT